jgi:hypothetical protein
MTHTAILRAEEGVRGDPITLTLAASRLDLSHFVGEVW